MSIFTVGQDVNVNNNYLIQHAINEIYQTFGERVSVTDKKKSLVKFGGSPNVGVASSRYTLWHTGQDQANETFLGLNQNGIDSISCSEANTEVVSIEGHEEIDGNKFFRIQEATLDGTNRVALTTPLNRVTRVRHADQSTNNLSGETYVYENTALSSGKPIDTTKIHITVPDGENQSQKASTSISSEDYWLITGFSAATKSKTGSNITDVRLEIRRQGGVFRPVARPLVVQTGGTTGQIREFDPYLIVPSNSDVRLTALSSGAGQNIVGDISGFLATIV